MKINKEMLRKTTAFIASISFLAVTNYNTADVIAVELASNQHKTADTNKTEEADDVSAQIKEYTDIVFVDEKSAVNEIVNYLNSMQNKPQDCNFSNDNGNIRISYKAYESEKESVYNEIKNFLSGITFEKAIGNIYYVFTADTEKSAVNSEKYYKLNIESNSPIESIDIDSANIKQTDDGTKYVKDGTEITAESFKIKDGYYLECLNTENKVAVRTPVSVNNESVVSVTMNNNNEQRNALFAIKKKKFRINFSVDYKIIIRLYRDGKTSYVLNSIDGNWVDIESDRVDFSFGKGVSLNKVPLKDDGKVVSWYYQCSIKELLEKADVDIDYNSDGEVIDINILNIPDTVESDVIYIDDSRTNVESKSYSVENNRVKIPFITKKGNKEFYLSRINYGYDLAKDFTDADVINSLENDFYNRDIDYYDGIKISTVYRNFAESENTIDGKTIIDSATANGGRRNDNTIIIDNNAELRLGDEFEGRYFLTVHNGEAEFTAVKDNILDLKDVGDEEVIEIQSLFDVRYNENNEIISVSSAKLANPVYLYVDKKAPVVTVDRSYITFKYKNNGWSNETDKNGAGTYSFRFNVTDGVSEGVEKEYSKINENPDINSVSEIKIGGLTFNRPSGDWGSEKVIKPVSDDGLDYTAVLKPLDTYGDFEVVITLSDSSIKGMNEAITVSATDYNNNTSSANVNVKIDTYAPQVKDIFVDNICTGLNNSKFIEHGKNLDITIIHSDSYKTHGAESGIESIYVKYGNNEKEIKNIVGSETKAVFNLRNLPEYTGKIQVTVIDKAGNRNTFYYCMKDDVYVTQNEKEAVDINIDNKAPAEPRITVSDADFKEGEYFKKSFYKVYPKFYFRTESRIKTLSFNINGKNISADIYDKLSDYKINYVNTALESGKMYLEFVVDKNDSRKFIPHIRFQEEADIDIVLSKEYISLDNGKLSVSLNITDFAGNTNTEHTEKSNKEIYIDNTAPEIDGRYIVDDAYKSIVNITGFGVFASKQIAIKVPFSDNENVSSGIKPENAVIEFSGKKYKAESITENEAIFVIPDIAPESDALFTLDGKLAVTMKDNVGNSSEKTVLHAENSIEDITFENVKPVISDAEITGENMFVNGAGEKWFSSDIQISSNISDEQSGIAKTIFNRYNADSNSEYNTEKTYKDSKTSSEKYVSSTETGRDGKYTFTVEVFDNAGNYDKKITEVYKDINAPYISGFNFDWNSLEEQKKYDSFNIVSDMSDRFSHFFESDTTMTVFARDDKGASSGIKSISCVLYNTDGTVFKSEENRSIDFDEENNVYSCQFVIPEGFKGDIKAWVTDNVNNKSDEKSPDGCASENDERHKATSHVDISMPKTDNKDSAGLPLYNSDVSAGIRITDSFSGIRRVEWLTSDFEGWRSIEIDSNGYISGDADGWNIDARDRNLATVISTGMNVSKDANNDFIRFRVFDNSGNYTESETYFSIDKQKPVINIDGIEYSQEKRYFNTNKKINVTISERNFNAPVINGQADKEFKLNENSRTGTDEQKYIKTFTYDKDGTYSLNIENTDLAGNKSDSFSSGEFVIDKTNPVLSVEFVKKDGTKVNPLVNGYIDSSVSAVIKVNEVNFDSSKIIINGKPSDAKWTGSGNVHTLEIPYNDNKSYSLTVSGKDIAGNAMNEYSVDFVVDSAKPEITSKSFSEANKGDVDISLSIKDSNIDTYEALLYRNGKICDCLYDEPNNCYKFSIASGKYIIGRWTVIDSENMEFVFDDFPHDEAFDGMYQLKIDVADKSLHKQSFEKSFSVNRFGSVFEIQEYESINGNYLNYTPEIVIKERNIDKHKDGSKPVILINKGTQTVELTDDMYSISKPQLLSDKSGYEYTYTISPDNFKENVRYKITIKSVDKAGNENVSEKRGADIEFNVDTRKPEPICNELDDNNERTFKGAEKEFTINVNEPLKNIRVMIDSQTEPLLAKEFEYGTDEKAHRFVVSASDDKRNITVELTDFAGNTTKKEYRGVRVTENMFLIMLSKPWLKIAGMISAGIALVTGLGIVFIRKRKQK